MLLDRTRAISVSKVKQLALVIPERPAEQPKDDNDDYVELPAITRISESEEDDLSLQINSPQKPANMAGGGRQSVSRDSLRQGFPVTSEVLPDVPAVSARDVKLEELGQSADANGLDSSKGENIYAEINKTFITQPLEKFPSIKDFKKEIMNAKGGENKQGKGTRLPNIY